jgi:hypothetical protein
MLHCETELASEQFEMHSLQEFAEDLRAAQLPIEWTSVNGMVRPCSRPATSDACAGRQRQGAMADAPKQSIAFVVGIDIGKNSFHIVGFDECGSIMLCLSEFTLARTDDEVRRKMA